MIIKNMPELLSHGNLEGRKIALDVIDYALQKIDSYVLTKKLVRLEGDILKVDSIAFNLSKTGDIYVVGAGKGASSIAEALVHVLGNRIKRGVIIEKRGQGRKLERVKVMEANHPLPDQAAVKGSKEIVEIARSAKKGDLVFACITGGCSALMTLPAEGISLEDIKKTTDMLLKSGATIEEINAVRKHISQIMGGRLAMHIHPAEAIGLIVLDEVAGLPWGPTVPDTSTFADAVSVLKKYDLREEISNSVKKHLETADPRHETLKLNDFERIGVKAHNIVLADNETLCVAAKKRAEELGLNSMILSTVMEGESRGVGIFLASIAKEVEKKGRPLKPPCVLISGGETVVTMVGKAGEGGRNQELALASSVKIDGSRNIVIASIGTDGTDGPTDVAGGIVDGYTLTRARKNGIEVFENLKRHNSSYVLKQLHDAIFTGPTGTNVMDLTLAVVTAA